MRRVFNTGDFYDFDFVVNGDAETLDIPGPTETST